MDSAAPGVATPKVAAQTASAEWKRNWPLAAAASIGFSFASLMTPILGLFMAPLHQAFGWSRAEITLGMSVTGVLGLVLAPLVGVAVDRFGTRRLVLPGLLLTAAALASFGLQQGSVVLWIGQWVIWSLCAMLIQTTVWTTAVARVFETSRGLALGVTLSGSALSQTIAPPVVNWLIETQGWRAAYAWLGFGWASIPFVLCLLFMKHDGRKEASADAALNCSGIKEAPILAGLTPAQAWRDTSLWRVAVATFLILSITIAVSVHQVPIYRAAGVSATNAAWLASLAGIAGIIGKLVTGALVDRFHVRWVGGITLASTAIAYPMLMQSAGMPALILAACMISGYAAGTKIQLCGYLTTRYAGMRNYGTIFGVMASLIALASAVGPLVASRMFDLEGNYDTVLLIGTIISLISGVLIFSLGPYPDWNNPKVPQVS